MTTLESGRSGRRPDVERVDDDGILLAGGEECVLDVCLDGRRVWSFWLERDTETVDRGRRLATWPTSMRRFLDGVTTLRVAVHGSEDAVFEDEVAFGASTARIAVVNASGQPLGIDKAGKLVPTFENRSAEHVAPLLDSVEAVLHELVDAGVVAFPAYGTLLGAVREGRLIGHDSDADLGYISRHSHPYDVIRESFELQRRLTRAGYTTTRYSGASFKVEVVEGDGFVRGLDVFGGYFAEGTLYLMGEIRAPFRSEWIFPPSTCTLEGRVLPAPAQPERLLEAMYGPSWRVPDPAFKFETPASTIRALNQYFRVARARRDSWSRWHGAHKALPEITPSSLAQKVVADEGVPGQLLDIGAGKGVDALWFARQGSTVTAYDFVPQAATRAVRRGRREGTPFESRLLNLQEWRSVFGEGARVSRIPGPRTLLARGTFDATPRFGRESLGRFAAMSLRGGGRLYADFWTGGGSPDGRPQRAVSTDEVADILGRFGANILQVTEVEGVDPADPDRRVGQVVAQWQ